MIVASTTTIRCDLCARTFDENGCKEVYSEGVEGKVPAQDFSYFEAPGDVGIHFCIKCANYECMKRLADKHKREGTV